jgi:sugar phosphate isomerase/epimerase
MTAQELADCLAIQSWCFRGFKAHAGVIEALRACDVSNLEISAAHFHPPADSGAVEVLEEYRNSGIEITAYGTCPMTADEAAARTGFEFARTAGFPTLMVGLRPDGIEVTDRLAKEYGIRVGVHNHGRRTRFGTTWELEELFACTGEGVGLCLDTAWAIDSREDPIAMARNFSDRLYGVHVKDFVFDRAGRPEDVVVGQGNLDLDAFLQTLIEIDFQGHFTLEFEGDIDNPVPATKQCVKAIRESLARLA